MRVKEKKDAVFVRGVVIACGEEDTTGDAPVDRESVKKIFSNYLTMETDVQHSWVKNFGVYVLENTITVNPCEIAGQDVPVGSWIASMMVTNPDIKAMIMDGRVRGYSVGAVGEKGLNENKHFLNKSLRYEDLRDAEELNPLFISLVENPANGYFLEVLDYEGFLAKSKDYELSNTFDVNVMSEKEDVIIENKEEESNSVIKTLTDAFVKLALSKNDDSKEKEEDEVVEEEDVPVDEDLEKSCNDEELEKSDESASDITNMELLEKLPVAVAEAVVEALKALAEESAPSTDDEVLEKDGDGDGDSSSSDDGETEEEDEEEEKEEEESSDNPQKKDKLAKSTDTTSVNDDVRLTKSTDKNMIPQNKTVRRNTFLNSDKRDMFGRNKRFL